MTINVTVIKYRRSCCGSICCHLIPLSSSRPLSSPSCSIFFHRIAITIPVGWLFATVNKEPSMKSPSTKSNCKLIIFCYQHFFSSVEHVPVKKKKSHCTGVLPWRDVFFAKHAMNNQDGGGWVKELTTNVTILTNRCICCPCSCWRSLSRPVL